MILSNLRLGLIGFGAIGRAIAARMSEDGTLDQIVGVLVRSVPPSNPALPFCSSIADLVSRRPTLVIEAAGHDAVRRFGPDVLRSGADLVIASVGALVDSRIMDVLRASSASGGGRAIIPAGAIAGLDGLAAARLAGLSEVCYTSKKPPEAWRGTAAEQSSDLDHPQDEVVFFDGSARDAAAQYPKNANVSAAIALTGIGLDKTRVRLVSSRQVSDPLGVIEASGAFGWFNFQIFANAFPDNPKSSMLTAYSLLQCARLGIGIPLDQTTA